MFHDPAPRSATPHPIATALTSSGGPYASEARSPEVQHRRRTVSRKCDASEEEGHAETGQVGSRWQGEEPQTGDRDRPVGGAEEGREGADEEVLVTEKVQLSLEVLNPEGPGILIGTATSAPVRDVRAQEGRRLPEEREPPSCHGAEAASCGPRAGAAASREVPNNADFLIRWIEVPQAIEPGTAMPNLGVTEGQAWSIAAYLYTLR